MLLTPLKNNEFQVQCIHLLIRLRSHCCHAFVTFIKGHLLIRTPAPGTHHHHHHHHHHYHHQDCTWNSLFFNGVSNIVLSCNKRCHRQQRRHLQHLPQLLLHHHHNLHSHLQLQLHLHLHHRLHYHHYLHCHRQHWLYRWTAIILLLLLILFRTKALSYHCIILAMLIIVVTILKLELF